MTEVLVCGATGFIGRNILERLAGRKDMKVHAVWHRKPAFRLGRVRWVRADLRRPEQAERAVRGMDVVIQAAATTSGAKDIVERPSIHVTDNAVMNSYLFRACHEARVRHVFFFSCSIMYSPRGRPAREGDFRGEIVPRYFGAGWTKVYLEKMCEFYARLDGTRFTAIRHSNIYGPHDKYDLERSHVFGATVAKVMGAKGGAITVWGDGSEERDLLYVGDLVDFVERAIDRQKSAFELVNVGSGRAVSVRDLARKIITASGKDLKIRFDKSKPTIPFKLALDCSRAKKVFGWAPRTSLERGIYNSLEWYRENNRSRS